MLCDTDVISIVNIVLPLVILFHLYNVDDILLVKIKQKEYKGDLSEGKFFIKSFFVLSNFYMTLQ